MTQNLLGFDELPIGSQISISTNDRGTLTGSIGPNAGTQIQQSEWFISSTGNPGAPGSAGAPMTEAQRASLWGRTPTLMTNTSVTYLDSPTDKVSFSDVFLADGAGLIIKGTPTVGVNSTGTFTAVTAQNIATNTPWDITDAALVGGFVPHVGQIIRITGGPRIGAYARIVLAAGATARVSPFGTYSPTLFTSFTAVVPLAGDPYEIITMPTLSLGYSNFVSLGNSAIVPGAPGTPTANAITIDTLILNGNVQQGVLTSSGPPLFVTQSILAELSIQSDFIQVAGGGGQDLLFDHAAVAQFSGTGFMTGTGLRFSVSASSVVQLDNHCYFQDASIEVDGAMLIAGAALFDQSIPDDAIDITGAPLSSVRVSAPGGLWGTGNAGHGVTVRSGRMLAYNGGFQPTVNAGFGAGREAQIGGTDTLWAAVPFINGANNAAIVVSS